MARKMEPENEKLMFVGLYMAKYNLPGIRDLGFTCWSDAFHTFANLTNRSWRSVKYYRDEFDPVFDNGRVGVVSREMYPTRKALLVRYGDLPQAEFALLIQDLFSSAGRFDLSVNKEAVKAGSKANSFAERLRTGKGAEEWFLAHYAQYPRFAPCAVESTIDLGCGFDYKLTPPTEKFLGVEVKGIKAKKGEILLTEKEHQIAASLKKRFYLYVVTNFGSEPIPCIIEDPLNSGMSFECKTSSIEQKVWKARIGGNQ